MTNQKRSLLAATERCCCVPESENKKPVLNRCSPVAVSAIGRPQREELCPIAGGWFQMGADDGPHPEDGEGPVRDVFVDDFFISPTSVTNEEFAVFVKATNYKTDAELAGDSFVFHLFDKANNSETLQVQHTPWWHSVKNACWCTPAGRGSSFHDQLNHPVTHISHRDARAYCQWAGVRLPTEAEWEYAARGGLVAKPYPWGDQLYDGRCHHANLWQGQFPKTNDADDGFVGTAPVSAYSANAFGLYNVIGNVWEWTADRHTRLHSPRALKNPKGPLNGDRFVAKGGSYLCHESYCLRYRVSSRQGLASNTTTDNVGFRVASG